jgi:hypothetical protein
MKHANVQAVSVDVANLLINVIHERDGYMFKQAAEAYAKNGHILTGLDSYDITSMKEYEAEYGLQTLIEALELYAEWYDAHGTQEGAEDDGHTAEGTV